MSITYNTVMGDNPKFQGYPVLPMPKEVRNDIYINNVNYGLFFNGKYWNWKKDEFSGNPHDLGHYANETTLIASHPSGVDGDFVTTQDPDALWLWDTGTSSWVNTGNSSVPGVYVRDGYSTRFNENVNVNTIAEALDTIFIFTSVPPTANVRVSPNNRYYEVGTNPTINVEGQGILGQNPQGTLTNLTINKDGGNFFTQANPASGTRYGQNDTVSITGTGAITTYQLHVDDDQGRSDDSGVITIYGAYPRYATTSNITTLTKQTLVPNNNTYFEFTSVPEIGGKYKADFRNNVTISGVQFYNTVSGSWEWMGGSQANSLGLRTVTATTHTIQGNVINYNRYEHNGVDGATLQLRFFN